MRRRRLLSGTAALVLALGLPAGASAETVLNVITAGSENMVDYVTDYLGPKFEASHPGVRVQVSGTGPGDAGSQKIYEKLEAQKAAGTPAWDVDVAVVHQKMAGQMVQEDLLAKYRDQIATGKLVSRDTAKNGARHRCRRLRHADVPQPDGARLQPRPGARAARLLRRAGRLGQGAPQAVRLQRHQERHVGGQLRGRLDVRQYRRGEGAAGRPLRQVGGAEMGARARQAQGLQPVRHLHPRQRRHAGHAEPGRDRDGPGLGRHVLHLAGRRPHPAERSSSI